MDWTQILICILTSITTLSVAALGLYQTKKTRETEEYRKIRSEIDQKNAEIDEANKKKQEERFQKMESNLKDLKNDVSDLKNTMSKTDSTITTISNKLGTLHIISSNNFVYMESLSNIVMEIGQAIDDMPEVPENEKQKLFMLISEHRKQGQDLKSQVYNCII